MSDSEPMKPHQAVAMLRDQHRDVIYQLGRLAGAFEITGNKTVARQLDLIAAQLEPLHEIVDKAIWADFDQQMAHSNAMHNNILKLALNGNIVP